MTTHPLIGEINIPYINIWREGESITQILGGDLFSYVSEPARRRSIYCSPQALSIATSPTLISQPLGLNVGGSVGSGMGVCVCVCQFAYLSERVCSSLLTVEKWGETEGEMLPGKS